MYQKIEKLSQQAARAASGQRQQLSVSIVCDLSTSALSSIRSILGGERFRRLEMDDTITKYDFKIVLYETSVE